MTNIFRFNLATICSKLVTMETTDLESKVLLILYGPDHNETRIDNRDVVTAKEWVEQMIIAYEAMRRRSESFDDALYSDEVREYHKKLLAQIRLRRCELDTILLYLSEYISSDLIGPDVLDTHNIAITADIPPMQGITRYTATELSRISRKDCAINKTATTVYESTMENLGEVVNEQMSKHPELTQEQALDMILDKRLVPVTRLLDEIISILKVNETDNK